MQMLGPVGYSRLIYILEMNPCMVGNTDWSDRYWHLLVTKIISTHAGRGEKLEHRRNDPPLGDERDFGNESMHGWEHRLE
jgi:hypothetical protein